MRINKFLAECGIGSRRLCDQMVADGKVSINGKLCSLGQNVDEENDSVTVDGKKVAIIKEMLYYVMNKPKGCVCTVKDEKDRKTVMNLLPKTSSRVYPIGRLDYDTEGLLIFTNDGDLAFRLTHPKNEIPKTYYVKIEGEIKNSDIGRLAAGVEIDGKMTNKSKVKLIETNKIESKLDITITEGRNRQVRKMFETIGYTVTFLKRIKIGDLTLRGLNRGETRKLSLEEIDYLKKL